MRCDMIKRAVNMSLESKTGKQRTSSPCSTASGCLSGDDTSEDTLPSNLAQEELQLALNKVSYQAKSVLF